MSEVYVGATMSDGMVYHVAFQTRVQAPRDPGPPWVGPDFQGFYQRADSDENIAAELARSATTWASRGVTMLSFRRLTAAEHDLFTTQRRYRNALVDVAGSITHDMPRARTLHREYLRNARAEKFVDLDAQWMRAVGQNRPPEAASIESERQRLRNLPQDPAIDTVADVAALDALWPVDLQR